MAEKELGRGKQLEKELCWEHPNIAKRAPEQQGKTHEFAKGYMEFLGAYKTERECVNYTKELLLEAGYKRFSSKKKYKASDKVFSTSHGKAMAITAFGKKPIAEGARISGAHIDSPRIGLRPDPLYGSNDIALFKIHYYGDVKKYQWGTIPLTMHGAVVEKDGTTVEITIGEDLSDPVLYITDLLIHLAKQQMQRMLSEGLHAEELNTVLGATPYPDDSVKKPFRLEAFRYLNERYDATEHDFTRAEVEFVPADKPRDIGFDRSLIGDYGQDDRVCAHATLRAQLGTVNPEYTTVTILTDKERIGSYGTTGSKSDFLYDYICYLAQMEGVDAKGVLTKPVCLSANVNGIYDSTFAGTFEVKNLSYLNCDMVLTKYTGSGGKFGVNGTNAELMIKVISIMGKSDIYWQIGELGKLDPDDGGMIADDVVRLGVDVVDLGIAVLSMHSSFKVTSKLGNCNACLAFEVFYPKA